MALREFRLVEGSRNVYQAIVSAPREVQEVLAEIGKMGLIVTSFHRQFAFGELPLGHADMLFMATALAN